MIMIATSNINKWIRKYQRALTYVGLYYKLHTQLEQQTRETKLQQQKRNRKNIATDEQLMHRISDKSHGFISLVMCRKENNLMFSN